MVNFTIHPLQSNDLRAAADCASATYSDGYYSVERIKEMSESENFTSYVAVDEAGSVAGHAGFRLFPAQNIAEMCAAFVSPDYRGGGCLNAIADFLVEEGERRGLDGLFVQSVCSHPYSQKAVHRLGFTDCAFLPGRIQEIGYRNMNCTTGERESQLISFRYLNKPKELFLFAPERSRGMIRSIFDHFDIETTFLSPALPSTPTGKSEISTKLTPFAGAATVTVDRIGADIHRRLLDISTSLYRKKFTSIALQLNMRTREILHAAECAESLGYSFCGVMPGSKLGGMLLFQLLNNYSIDFGHVNTNTRLGREIAEYVYAQKPTGQEFIFRNREAG